MIVNDQKAVFAFLEDASSYAVAGQVETMETHISRVFLIDGRAFKLKRAVKLPYVDFSTPELRFDACLKEVSYNSLSAPELYIGVRRITEKPDGGLSFDGDGKLVDAVVEMFRFEQEALLDHVAARGELTPALMTETARKIVSFHHAIPAMKTDAGASNIAGVLDINEGGFATSHVFSEAELVPFNKAFRDRLDRYRDILDERARAGKIRRCHGDLHLRNICIMDGHPRLFDGIEFNDQIATIDVLYDLAFLLMDLGHQGFGELANLVANRYLDETDNEDGFVLLPFFMAIRAAVRAHVTATLIEEGGQDPEALTREARSYFDLASRLLKEEPSRFIAIGGFSGSGKSTVAELLAPMIGPPPGARIIESDRIRKAMFGVSAETRFGAAAYSAQYSPENSRSVYAEMAARSATILRAGGSVITEAVYADEDKRADLQKSIVEAGATFHGFWLDVADDELLARVKSRKDGASDADTAILALQLEKGAGGVNWHHVDGRGTANDVAGKIRNILEEPQTRHVEEKKLGFSS